MIPNMQKNWRDLIKPRALEVDAGSSTPIYAKFVARPLERGFGTTLGNSLRRVLLSSLQGTAVAAVRIHGVQHEFSTIADIAEDVTEIILNIKEIRLKALTSANQFTISVEKEGEGVVRASDIGSGGLVEILNPNHKICSLGSEGKFKAEFLIKTGRGFVSAESNKNEDLPIGWIAVDSIFSPVRKVNYTVSQARVGQRTDYDRLQLEVWTDGSVKPEDAVALGSKIIRDQMTVFLNFQEEEEPLPEEQTAKQESFNPNLYRTVDELELSVRSANCLQNANIKFIYELVQKTEAEMLRTKNFGRKSLNEIKEILASMGLHLGMKLDGFVPPAITNTGVPAAPRTEIMDDEEDDLGDDDDLEGDEE
jgi:DNA-directed RNA polymerase subunit alpha